MMNSSVKSIVQAHSLKPLCKQVVVLTGACSPAGLVTARLLAAHGARLVLVGTKTEALEALGFAIQTICQAVSVVTLDAGAMTDLTQLKEGTHEALSHVGPIDTWISLMECMVIGHEDNADEVRDSRNAPLDLAIALSCLQRNSNGGSLIQVGYPRTLPTISLLPSNISEYPVVLDYCSRTFFEPPFNNQPVSVRRTWIEIETSKAVHPRREHGGIHQMTPESHSIDDLQQIAEAVANAAVELNGHRILLNKC